MKKHYLTTTLFFLSTIFYAQEFTVEPFATGMVNVVEISNASDDRLFAVEQEGVIRIVNTDGSVNPTPFLDISSIVGSGGERGLLGLAFAPDYETTGRFYINYTNLSGNTVIARYTVSDVPDIANTDGTILLTIEQPFSNHNGGSIHFGSDGYLWISMGDGGSGGDPNNYGQNTNLLLGKMLRIDVSGSSYTTPSDNPFATGGGAPEIWSYGLRNAWKFSFDRETGDVWIADVGQNAIEEINMEPSTSGGLNYGWRCYEGDSSYDTSGCASSDTMTFPLVTYNHSNGRCSITGGYVYRGTLYPNLVGKYFFADYCSGEIGWVEENTLEFLVDTPNEFFSTFGEDVNGELYAASGGMIYKIVGQTMEVSEVEKKKVSIYPNPTEDIINIESEKLIDQITLYSVDGKLIQKFEPNTKQINISPLAKGFYLLVISSDNTIQTEKIVKR